MADHHIALVGGGHTHVQVLREFGDRPEPGARLTLVTDRVMTPYSGMLPGHVAGVYSRAEMHIDLEGLARRCGVALCRGTAVGIDRKSRELLLADGERLAYDTLSLNLGITPDLTGIAGADRHAIAVKPISGLLQQLDTLFAGEAVPRRILMVGGGPAGVEIALALRTRFQAQAAQPWIAIAAGDAVTPSLNPRMQQRVRAALARRDVTLLAPCRIAEVHPEGAVDTTGQRIAADAVIVSTAARAPAWLATTGLRQAADGSVLTADTLASVTDGAIFAVGDCAAIEGDRREKAGVFAVRQGPPLIANLRRRVRAEPLGSYRAQRDYLAILATGDGSAIAGRGRWLAVEGRWVWRWKDWLDRSFMARFAAGSPG
ncbi:MAG: FAD-dependent oxidoreductase [Phreatobacter sp.]|uniref:FAD-dependent oxidoreductase n=1 Tax=Phreatobacter sp. TaxID=1966341 RepID=UPI00273754CA|nr:FAD-dependent oxidoreductase [Phreatobacter sp.]MDP2803417.1 FAD-dependent oxidoreductase [Phreatobacter sp.]